MAFDTETTIYIIMEVLIGFISVVGNALVSYVILQSHKFRKMPMFLFILSLAFADLFVGLVAAPFGILTKLGFPQNNPVLCIVMITFIVIPAFTSVYNLTAVSIERYLAIRFPLYHSTRVTVKTSNIVIAISWIVGLFVGLMPISGWNIIDWSQWHSNQGNQPLIPPIGNDTFPELYNATSTQFTHECIFVKVVDPDFLFFNFIFCGLFPLSVCAVLYLLIYMHVLKIKNPTKTKSVGCKSSDKVQIKSRSINITCVENTADLQKNSCNSSTVRVTSLNSSETTTRKISRKRRQHSKQETRIAIVLGLTVLGFAICWLPLHILNTIARFSPVNPHIPVWVVDFAVWLTHVNSAVNIFLYSWRIESFHKELKKKVLKKLFSFGRTN